MTASNWTTVRIRNIADRGAVIAKLFELGAEGVEERDDAIITHLRNADHARLTNSLRFPEASVRIELSDTPDVDWSKEWRSRLGAHRVDRLVVTPPWLAQEYKESERVVIDPGMAFGTGDHESTRGVLRLMQHVVRKDDVVADLGAGSAVLSIAAVKLGAKRAVAIEVDPDAIGNAEANVSTNRVSERVSVIEGDALTLLPLIAPVRVVLANIVSSVLIAMLPTIAQALTIDGAAILGGILLDERTDLEVVLARDEWTLVQSDTEGMWWSAIVGRP